MSAASNPQPRREEILFDPNLPVTLALKYAQGRNVSGRNGERIMFTTADNRVFFTDLVVARQIEELGIQPGETFSITKVQRNGKGPITFAVARVHGEQPNGTFTVPVAPSGSAAARSHVAGSAVAAAPPNPTPPAAETPRKPMASAGLVEEANALVDSYMHVLAHARKTHGDAVDPDSVRLLVTTAYIQRAKLSSVA